MADRGYLWIIGIALIVVGLQAGWFDNLIGGSDDVRGDIPIYPSDLETTIDLNTKDALATTDINANVTYYVFKAGTGEFIKSGTTSDGSSGPFGQDGNITS